MPVFAYETAMANLSAEMNSTGLFIQEDQKRGWILNEDLYERSKYKAQCLAKVPKDEFSIHRKSRCFEELRKQYL